MIEEIICGLLSASNGLLVKMSFGSWKIENIFFEYFFRIIFLTLLIYCNIKMQHYFLISLRNNIIYIAIIRIFSSNSIFSFFFDISMGNNIITNKRIIGIIFILIGNIIIYWNNKDIIKIKCK